MAYKYFSESLLGAKPQVNLTDVFSDKQQIAKSQLNVDFGLYEILEYLKKSTNNFKLVEQKFIDLDNGIKTIVYKYFTANNLENPFETYEEDLDEISDTELEDRSPSDAVIVKDGKIEKKKIPTKTTKEKTSQKEKDFEEWELTIDTLSGLLKDKSQYTDKDVSEWESVISALVESFEYSGGYDFSRLFKSSNGEIILQSLKNSGHDEEKIEIYEKLVRK